MRPLRSIDGVLTASAAAFYLSGEFIARRRSEPDPASAGTGATPGEINGFDRRMWASGLTFATASGVLRVLPCVGIRWAW